MNPHYETSATVVLIEAAVVVGSVQQENCSLPRLAAAETQANRNEPRAEKRVSENAASPSAAAVALAAAPWRQVFGQSLRSSEPNSSIH